MKKSIIGFIFGAILTLSITSAADTYYQFVASQNTLYVDDVKIEMPLYNYQYTNYAPIRAVAEALGLDIKVTGTRIDFTSPLTDLETVAKNCKDSCVMVYAHTDKKMKQGSGWAYNGYIVTAKHVIDGMERFYIQLDNSHFPVMCEVYYVDPDLDLAVLKTDTPISTVKLGDTAKEGEKLVAITSPNSNKNAIDECVYSGMGNALYKDLFMVSEANLAPGSSGGAIFNYSSEIIGMVTRGGGSEFLVIPINDIKPILEKLK